MWDVASRSHAKNRRAMTACRCMGMRLEEQLGTSVALREAREYPD
jgi:hypothetical protein